MQLLNILTIAIPLASALPYGSPQCVFNETNIQRGMPGVRRPIDHKYSLGFSMEVSMNYDFIFTGQLTYNFQLQGQNLTNGYQGLLMYVTNGVDLHNHLGNFTDFDVSKFKHVDLPFCKREKVLGLPTASITHSNPEVYPEGTNFTWAPNKDDFKNGSLVLSTVVIAYSYEKEALGYQQLPDVTVPAPGFDIEIDIDFVEGKNK
ncbi:hypothetical protein HDV04_004762 [Boothiomyces sp. JEL0838]|nr:hypothetical protein HDV04_004762 [Boothiomyces sp. JEL0838]